MGIPVSVDKRKTYINSVCLLFNGISTFLGYLMPDPSF